MITRQFPQPKTFARSRFGTYGDVQKSEIRKLKVEENPRLERIWGAWKELTGLDEGSPEGKDGNTSKNEEIYNLPLFYHKAESLLRGIGYDSNDVGAFISRIIPLQEGWREPDGSFKWRTGASFGVFLGALTNNGKDEEYRLPLGALEFELYSIGYLNRKKLTITGNVGNSLGRFMESGEIHLIGNAGENVGMEMESGMITVSGDAGKNAGYYQRGGTIRINGEMETCWPIKIRNYAFSHLGGISIAITLATVGLLSSSGLIAVPYLDGHLPPWIATASTALGGAMLAVTLIGSAIYSFIGSLEEAYKNFRTDYDIFRKYRGEIYNNGKYVFRRD